MVTSALAPKVFQLRPLSQFHKLVRENVMAQAWTRYFIRGAVSCEQKGMWGQVEWQKLPKAVPSRATLAEHECALSQLWISSPDSVLHVSSSNPSLHPQFTLCQILSVICSQTLR